MRTLTLNSAFRTPHSAFALLPLVRLPEGMHAEGLFDLGVFPPQVVAHAVGRDGVSDRHVPPGERSEEHTSELQSQSNLVCRLLLEKKKKYTSKYLSSIMCEEVNCSPRT